MQLGAAVAARAARAVRAAQGVRRAGGAAAVSAAGGGGDRGGDWDGEGALLPVTVDSYGGVTVDLRGDAGGGAPAEGTPGHSFRSRLLRSEAEWEREGRTGAWLVLPPALAGTCSGPALEAGFELHHATRDKLVLNKWLAGPAGTSRLPKYAHTLVGVGTVVLNGQGEMLVVQEKHGVLRGQGVWKMPTGLAEPGEDLQAAALREVYEETGVECRFDGLLSLRQMHGGAFAQSDLFFICALSPKDCQAGDSPPPLRCQTDELEDCRWMPLQEYFAQPWWTEQHDDSSVYGVVNRLIADHSRGGGGTAPLQSLANRRGSARKANLFSFSGPPTGP